MDYLTVSILILVAVPCAALALSVVAACMLSSQLSRREERRELYRRPQPLSIDESSAAAQTRKRAKYPCAHKPLTERDIEELRWGK